MKNYTWIVEVKNPTNIETVMWRSVAETLEKVAKNWNDQTNNTYLSYSKLHNIYHKRNVKDNAIIKIQKLNQKLDDVNITNIDV